MNLKAIFQNSILLPKKEALFKLNRISMRDTLVYIILLFLLLFLPDVIGFVSNVQEAKGEIPDVVIIQVLFLYPAFTIFFTILTITILSGIAYLLRNILIRKLAYHQLWKMTSYALTWPIILYLFIKVINLNHLFVLLILMLFFYLMTKMIQIYPKKS